MGACAAKHQQQQREYFLGIIKERIAEGVKHFKHFRHHEQPNVLENSVCEYVREWGNTVLEDLDMSIHDNRLYLMEHDMYVQYAVEEMLAQIRERQVRKHHHVHVKAYVLHPDGTLSLGF